MPSREHEGLAADHAARVQKLVADQHVNVAEHRLLQNEGLRGSEIRAAVADYVRAHGRYPAHAQPGDAYHGGILLAEGARWVIYWQAEVGVGKTEVVERQSFDEPQAAIEAFAVREWANGIDGLGIDWTR